MEKMQQGLNRFMYFRRKSWVKEDTGSEGLKGEIRAATFIVANILSSNM